MAFTRDSIREDNICVIWVDDMIDVFTWRNAFGVTIRTPNIDMLLGAGVRFANTYATVPLCAPCRAEITTGISPYRSGLVDLNRVWRDVMPPEKAWAYDLRRAGFRNFTTGKTDAHYVPMPEEYRRILFHEDAEASDKGGRKGQWSARKAQLAVQRYKAAGGGYEGRKSADNHLVQWEREEWGTKSGDPSKDTGERYLPKAVREALTDEEYERTTAKKRADTRAGKQFSAQPEDVAEKAADVRLHGLSRAELLKRAAERGIAGRSRMRKAELIDAIRNHG